MGVGDPDDGSVACYDWGVPSPSLKIFTHHADFDPAQDFEAFLKSVPGKWAVYLMADADDRAVQLLCVKNLRYSLERRLGDGEVDAGPSRKVNYREIIRRIY